MKNFISICLLFISVFAHSQVQWNYISSGGGKCVDVYDGTITYSISGAAPPFTAVITNTAGCAVANSTVTSTTSQITFTGVPGCTSFYYLALYNSNNTLISNFQTSFGVYSNTPFNISIASFTAASCSSCCDAKAYPGWSGGSFPPPSGGPLFYLDNVYLAGNFFPIMNICAGTHTLCANDNVGCQKCIVFTIPALSTNVNKNESSVGLSVFPNPAAAEFNISGINTKAGDKIEIVSIHGEVVVVLNVEKGLSEIKINTDELAKGIYFVKLISVDGLIKGSNKVLKN